MSYNNIFKLIIYINFVKKLLYIVYLINMYQVITYQAAEV